MNNTITFDELITRLAPTMEQLEEKRKELKAEAFKKSTISFGVCFALAITGGLITREFPVCLVIGSVFFIISLIVIFSGKSKILSSFYKEKIITQFVESLIDNGKYEPETGISEQTFNQSKLFNQSDRYHSEDYISGKTGQTPFCFAEIHAEEKHTHTDSKGKTTTTWTTLFKGFFFIADFNKDFAGQTVIFRNSLFNFIRSNRVKLENPDFEKRFDVSSSDQVEARYLLSPAMMERIIVLDKQFKNGVLVSFCNSNVIIAINNSRDHFESSLWRPINHTDTLREEYDTITSLLSIINTLDLNTRIWTKK